MQTARKSPVPALLVLDAERRILSATETAAHLLHTTANDLIVRRLGGPSADESDSTARD